ncbi:SMP-30/gluconolactonase/LRE family protein [Allokutzneria sp. A3M-2-11 16]|uniref:SMP-30/gluconolactonase/LRE family protein n=1 Tax=Allokutzneria sp. A3M-2-11 16 TaxID=2962043 RepID=UPI0020B8B125|nr:SMP-30/gluconolactonase/LRE family protein [Allokutzneria sp. A3M-2-11 16]MCP3804072.1 SMP-30/gluconolactonase/LRE family protein [Allokutzneria sp. A3M-2-11 16]
MKIILVLAAVAGVGFTNPGTPSWTGLLSPESITHDTHTDTYLASNINGGVAVKDNNGFIARLSPSGGAATRWVEGGKHGVTLNAPKGLALTWTTVWVADIDTVRGFDRTTGKPVAQIPVPGATFLNDIAVGPRGELYVTDSGVGPDATGAIVPTGTDAVHVIDRGRVRPFAVGTHLNQPNGIFVRPNGSLLVATRGADQVLTLDRTGSVTARRTVPGRVVDGVQVLPDGRVAATTWNGPGLWQVNPDGTHQELVPGLELPGAADFSVDRKRSRLLLPLLLENQLRTVTLS